MSPEIDLDSFRKSQRLAYECALAVRAELKEGWTEKQTAKLMDTWLRDFGVKAFFHKSFAWFGERSRFRNFSNYLHFLPSDRRLRAEDVVILDTAPILGGFTSDIGYTFSLQPNPGLERAMRLLRAMRAQIPKLFESQLRTDEIWKKIDLDLKSSGFDNCHEQYPFSVLAHQVHHVPLSNWPGLTIPFSLHAYWSILSRGLKPELLGPGSVCKKQGLWAVEPHLGGEGFGAKFEEILVVEDGGRAYWLDDDVPHLRPA
ncbi:MAG: aminopeptidase P family protein [Deltaproteobacteria bacterium]|nr:aminopeptidase P family protein [Deltaproteobacteria bacterium]